ncbi:MAG: AbrB/MazE/SpoVT family DNA-binding domain-containing protein [Halobaculum sp.]
MATDESTVADDGTVELPESVRRRLDIEPGDTLRWDVDDGTLSVAVVRQRYGAFEDDDVKAEMGGDGLETHDIAGREDSPAFAEDG